jgi:hypothetical protein
MLTLIRLRRSLFLRQIDVENATGISVHRLSAAERGPVTLSEAEYRIVAEFLQDRLKSHTQLTFEINKSAGLNS